MQRSPFNGMRVSVRDVPRASAWSNLQAILGSRWNLDELSVLLQRRATLHLSVLAIATAVLAGSLIATTAPGEAAAIPVAAETDTLTQSARTAIVAKAIPFTNTSSDATYSVESGDNLPAIARRVGVSEEALLAYNELASSDSMTVGLRLRIPDLSKVPPAQLRLKDTAPHDSTPLVDPNAPLPPQKPAPELTIHQVLKGETVSAIARLTGVTEQTVLVSNNLQPSSTLYIGQTLVVPDIDGRLVAAKPGDTISGLAGKYGGTTEGILAANKLDPRTQEITPDQLVLVPANSEIAIAVRGSAAKRTEAAPPIDASDTKLDGAIQPTSQTQDSALVKPVTVPKPASAPGLIWPAPGYISTYFSSWHNGIDIVNSIGTPVHAVQAGRVVYSGWDNSGYGYMIRIDHGNGLQTLYGHASRLISKVGDYVEQGEVVMLMGSTGRSTGSHVHFSVFQGAGYNGLNPLKFLP